ncbi:MAG: glutamine--tRNA ligase/YqeY domain fusion protein [Firmicutes bacterium]|nr:glutamine--tRNA ligase/YqeY domain fusion protein [Bacillota bacterium]MCL1954030.1 glutamine--tRNA ligase/YqeY domain fusion protein [Bacillota bacterium]
MANFIEEVIERDLATKKHTKIALRYPPEPNGYLHIGHAKAILINYGLAQKYNGTCNLRFDDTNPIKENDEYVQAIIQDMKWLGWQGNIYYASDYFEKTLEIAKSLILKGVAYVDLSTPEEIKDMRGTLTQVGRESKYRNTSIDDNTKLFQDMIDGKFEEGKAVLRAKIDMSSPNMNMRDPIIYRVLNAHHYRQGDKYKVYPMYDFAHPIQDAIEGITHSCCSLEFENNRPLYDWVIQQSACFETIPHQYEFARLNIDGYKLSKRHLINLVQDNLVQGWDDPRMPTLVGLRRRGYTANSIKKFCNDIGVSKSNSTVDIAMLESCIRDELNHTAQRAMVSIDPIELVVIDRDDNWTENLELDTVVDGQTIDNSFVKISNKIYIDRADFAINPPPKYKRLTVGGLVRLKAAYIVKCEKYDTDCNGNVVKVYVSIVPNSKSGQDKSGLKGVGVIHWVDAKNSVDIKVRHFDKLLDENDKYNPNSIEILEAKMDKDFVNKAERFQFLRHGYYCIDKPVANIQQSNTQSQLVFNRIVGLKDGFKH